MREITLEWYADAEAAGEAERSVIRAEQPKYNSVHKSPRILSAVRPKPAVLRSMPANERRAAFASALDNSPNGVSAKDLIRLSGLSSSGVHARLGRLIEAGAVRRLGRGRYRVAPGRSVAAAMRSGRT